MHVKQQVDIIVIAGITHLGRASYGVFIRHSSSSFYGPPAEPIEPSVISQDELEDQRKRHTKHYTPMPKERVDKSTDPSQRLAELQKDTQKMVNFKKDYPDFLPMQDPDKRDRLMEMLEREDMLRRRRVLDMPLFFVGSIIAVTVADKFGKESRFLGLCIKREGHGLRHTFTLRNIIDQQGVEVKYDMYSPLIQKLEIIRLEKRLDDDLTYLRDAPQEYSFFPQDMRKELVIQKEGIEVPVNPLKVKLNCHPWSQRYERMNLKGVQYPLEFRTERAEKKLMHKRHLKDIAKPWEKQDIMKHYRDTLNPVETQEIMSSAKERLAEIAAERQAERQQEEDEMRKLKGWKTGPGGGGGAA